MRELSLQEVEQVNGAVSTDATWGGAIAFVGMAIAGAATFTPAGVAVLCGASLALSAYTAYKDMS